LEDKEVLEDLLGAAVNDAVRKVEARNRDAMSDLASGLNLPAGFKLPF
jgi:DNA-binding protein YbaB